MDSFIHVEGAYENNLKNITIDIPKNKFVAVVGLSGSGKSSLVFDTLQRECQRQYMESLGMITEQISKPKVKKMCGLSPSISIGHRVINNSPRSTVGTNTELYTYLRVLFAKFGMIKCPNCGNYVEQYGKTADTNDEDSEDKEVSYKIYCDHCGAELSSFTMSNFSFNKPEGACKACTGLGKIVSVDFDAILDDSLTLEEGAIKFWAIPERKRHISTLKNASEYFGFDFDLSVPVKDFTQLQKDLLFYGIYDSRFIRHFPGKDFPRSVDQGRYDGVVNVIMNRYKERGAEEEYYKKIKTLLVEKECHECGGTRLNKQSREALLGNQHITDVCKMSLEKMKQWLLDLESNVSNEYSDIVKNLSVNMIDRLDRLIEVGLGYLTLDRPSNTLSVGEYQRLRMASLLGSGLTGVLYVLDEPTTGLHQRDTAKLVRVIRKLRDLGNTVMVVEHDIEMIKAADYIIEIGPGAGKDGGEVVAFGTVEEIINNPASVIGKYLSADKYEYRCKSLENVKSFEVIGARSNNLKHVNASFKIGKINVVTGVSGSGKSSLIFDTLKKSMIERIENNSDKLYMCDRLEHVDGIEKMIIIDQTPIGRSPRSNAATYTDVFNHIRDFYSKLDYSIEKKLEAKSFSFNVPGGRCERCQGAGVLQIEMHFLPTEEILCPECKGKRFKKDILKAKYKGKSISDVLNMTISDAAELFRNEKKIYEKLELLEKVGLGYLTLGQSATTISCGEAQRVKIAKELGKSNRKKTLYIMDEPTTGLHPEDVERMSKVIEELADNNNTVIIVEHNMDIIKMADWVVDLGPEGGDNGGEILVQGTISDVINSQNSITGRCLKQIVK